MRKLLFEVVALVSAAGAVACGNGDKARAKPSDVVAPDTVARRLEPSAAGIVKNVEPVDLTPQPKFMLVLAEGKTGFKFRSTTLSDGAKAKIDEMFTGDKFDLSNSKFEIEGHTDNLGSAELNHQVGLARAEAVKQYLGEYHEIPGDWITVVSYGMEQPAGDNATPEGRAKNRRVVIKVVNR